jgi:hypothetical protein
VSVPQWVKPYSANYEIARVSQECERARDIYTRAHLAQSIQSFGSADVPLPLLLNLGKDPRLDQSSSSDHHSIDSTLFDFAIIRFGGETVTVTKDWRRRKPGIEAAGS